ncbi:trypsin-like peptidase domain-containing protein [Streptomyces sp. NPDC020403]|uniref:nSTAND1 domain-containing NTPase n=1 Tax=unclassified Streptomyces TaxID=2593676 RepID=UPI0033C00B1F
MSTLTLTTDRTCVAEAVSDNGPGRTGPALAVVPRATAATGWAGRAARVRLGRPESPLDIGRHLDMLSASTGIWCTGVDTMEPGSAAPSDASVARVLGIDGRPEGAGFRAGQREVITCAHVVATALGLPPDTQEPPDSRLWIDFPLVEPGTRVPARVGAWTPVRADGSGDVAVLELLVDPPAKAPVARLVEDAAGPDRRVRTFGFPRRYDDGTWSVGWLRGATGAGWLQYDTDPASEHRVEQGYSGAPVWDVAEGGVVGMVVAADARADVRTAYLIPVRTLRETWSGLSASALPACPFRSLEPFGEQDAALFHGRAEPADRIAGLLSHAPVTSLVGPSGCGKSSLLHAGVLPRLRGTAELEIVVFRPGRLGRSPLEALALALLPRLEPDLTEAARLAELPALTALLRDGQLPALVERLLVRQGKERLILVADQFEEALTGTGGTTAHTELDSLAAALTYCLHRGSRMRLVISLRADFLAPALAHAGLAPLLAGERLFTVGAMSDAELRAAVELPLTGTGTTYEPGLVDRILSDVGSDPGRLPLLEFTLTKLWERQRYGRIGHTAYESLGRVHDALVTHAEQVWTDALSETEQQAARALLVQLVHPGDDRIAPTRRTLARSELRPEQWRLAQRLMTTRLLIPGEDYRPDSGPPEETVELAHETLLTHWDRLRAYVAEDRDFRMWQEGLRRRIALWSADDRPGRRLLRGQDLRDARRWGVARTGELRPGEEAFIKASDRSARRRVTGLIAVGVTLALLAGLGSWAWRADISQDAAARASDVLVQQSRDADMGKNAADFGMSYTALLLALRAYRTQDTPRTRQLLGEMYARFGFADLLAPRYRSATTAVLDPLRLPTGTVADEKAQVVVARTGENDLVVLRRDASGLRRVETRQEGDVTAVSPDGTMVALADSTVISPDLTKSPDPTRTMARLLTVATGRIVDLEAPRGGDPFPKDIDTGPEIPGLEMPTLPDIPGLELPTQYARLAFDQESEVLLGQTGLFGQGGRLVVWNAADGRIKKVMPGLPDDVEQLWLRGGGERLLTVADRSVSLTEQTMVVKSWDLTGAAPVGREVMRWRSTTDKPVYMDVSPDLRRLGLVETDTGTGSGQPALSHRIAVHDLDDGRLLQEERSTQQVPVSGITLGSAGVEPLAYYLAGEGPPIQAPGEGPVRTIGAGQIWSGLDLTGPADRTSVVLDSMGVVAVVGPGDGDALGRLPAPGAKPVTSASVEQARGWMTRLCRILGDDSLPPAVSGNVPPGAYRGPLCEGRSRTRG